MTWVLVGLVTFAIVGVVVYLMVVKTKEHEAFGALDVPGDDTIELPEGHVAVYYDDERRWRFSDRPEVGDGFSVLISDEEGNRVDLGEPESDVIYKGDKRNRIPFGTLDLPKAGTYRIVTHVDEGMESPRVTFGR